MKVRALIQFEDYLEHETRNPGDIFEVTEERLNEILTKGGPWVQVIEEDVEEKAGDIKPKGRKKGKA